MKDSYQDKLAHLSKEEIKDLMELYYDGENVELLIKEYKVDVRNSLLSKTFPLTVYKDVYCPFCSTYVVSYKASKSSYSEPDKFCLECLHQLDKYCNCTSCVKEREQLKKDEELQKEAEDEEKRDILITLFEDENEYPVDIEELSLKSKIYISSLLRAASSEDLGFIKPINQSSPFAPTEKYMSDIISYLRDERIILFSPSTHLDSIVFEDGSITAYYPKNTTFELNIEELEYKDSIESLLHLKEVDYISSEEKILLWSEIGLYECLEFLYAKLDEYNLPEEHIGEKTISSIEEALNNYSISQLYNFIWRAVKNAAAFRQKNGITPQHAVNSIAGSISRSSEKAHVEKWDVKGYGRDYNYPQTIISEIFFNSVLQVGDKGFTSIRSLNSKNEKET